MCRSNGVYFEPSQAASAAYNEQGSGSVDSVDAGGIGRAISES